VWAGALVADLGIGAGLRSRAAERRGNEGASNQAGTLEDSERGELLSAGTVRLQAEIKRRGLET
jgi:hypothetical protein